ncbi:hypothetical protein BC940DRAFT_333271 [Gongronella butleri]|nr:hypothetical protein BC940DRAFT_333271 [Gongronella butleri]
MATSIPTRQDQRYAEGAQKPRQAYNNGQQGHIAALQAHFDDTVYCIAISSILLQSLARIIIALNAWWCRFLTTPRTFNRRNHYRHCPNARPKQHSNHGLDNRPMNAAAANEDHDALHANDVFNTPTKAAYYLGMTGDMEDTSGNLKDQSMHTRLLLSYTMQACVAIEKSANFLY